MRSLNLIIFAFREESMKLSYSFTCTPVFFPLFYPKLAYFEPLWSHPVSLATLLCISGSSLTVASLYSE